jgi:hypothetical protein
MKSLQITLSVLLVSVIGVGAETEDWKSLLNKPVDDRWQQIVGVGIAQETARKRETLSAKIAAIQELIREDHGQLLPIFVPPSFGVQWLDPIPKATETRTGLPISKVPAMEVFRYIADLCNHEVVETEVGIVFRAKQVREPEADGQPATRSASK